MKITDVEAIVLRQPALDAAIADGSQDDLIVRVHTDAGIVGVGEVDSAPEVAKAVIEAPASHAIASGLRHVLLGEDPLDVEPLWTKMYRAAIYYGRRGVALHALSGIDIALWDIKGKALGKSVSELIGPPRRQRVRAYASTLMPDTADETSRKVSGLIERYGFTALKLGWGPQGQNWRHDVRLATAARRAAGDHVDILIDAGLGYEADADTAIRVAREYEQRASSGSRSHFCPTSSRHTRGWPIRWIFASRPARKIPRYLDFASWSSAGMSMSVSRM